MCFDRADTGYYGRTKRASNPDVGGWRRLLQGSEEPPEMCKMSRHPPEEERKASFKLNEEGNSSMFLKALLTRCVLGCKRWGEEA